MKTLFGHPMFNSRIQNCEFGNGFDGEKVRIEASSENL